MSDENTPYEDTDAGVTTPDLPQEPQPQKQSAWAKLPPEKKKQMYLLLGAATFLIILFLVNTFKGHKKKSPSDLATNPVQIQNTSDQEASPGLFFQNSKKQNRQQQSQDANLQPDSQLKELQNRLKLLQARAQIRQIQHTLSLPVSGGSMSDSERKMLVDLAKKGHSPISSEHSGNMVASNAGGPGSVSGGAGTYRNGKKSDLVADTEDLEAPPKGMVYLRMGTFLNGVLVNKLVTDNYTSPVMVMIDRNYYDPLTHKLLIPAGTKVLGKAQAVKYQTASKLAITFDVFQFPNGSSFKISPDTQALEGLGDFGLADNVNRHTWRVLLTAGLVGVLTGWNASQVQGNGYGMYSGQDQMRIQANNSISQTGQQLLSPFLNAVPTITVDVGHRLKIWMTRNVAIPEYKASPLE